jgi:hypothetical protein
MYMEEFIDEAYNEECAEGEDFKVLLVVVGSIGTCPRRHQI